MGGHCCGCCAFAWSIYSSIFSEEKKIESLRMYGAPLRLFCFGWGQVGSGGPFVAVQGVSRCGKGSHSGHPITMMCSDSNAWNDWKWSWRNTFFRSRSRVFFFVCFLCWWWYIAFWGAAYCVAAPAVYAPDFRPPSYYYDITQYTQVLFVVVRRGGREKRLFVRGLLCT